MQFSTVVFWDSFKIIEARDEIACVRDVSDLSLSKLSAKLSGSRDSINEVANELSSEFRVVDVDLLNDRVEKNVKDLFEIVDCNNVSYDDERIVHVADQDEAERLQSKREVCRISLFYSIAEITQSYLIVEGLKALELLW